MTNRRTAGFTLIEMAMVLMIVGLLLAGLIPAMSGQMESQNINETRKQLDDIKEALIGFTIRNGRLPCPADSTIPTGQQNAGQESRSGTACTNIINNRAWGVLPWVDLGVNETDAWGRRFSYRVASYFADDIANKTYGSNCGPNPDPNASFALCSKTNLLNAVSSSTGSQNIAVGVPVILISHGKNGLGAYAPNGQKISVTGASTDELYNTYTLYSDYISHDATPTFDDLLTWISPNILFNRMVTVGKLP